jgi:tetratricopeptide (TPR) repeat protein
MRAGLIAAAFSKLKEVLMKRPIFSSIISVLTLSISLTAQLRPGASDPHSGSGEMNIPRAPDPRTDGPDTLPRVMYLSGKVVVDDGSPLIERALIQSNCKDTVRTEGYTDQKGRFSFEFADTRNRALSETGMASDTPATVTFPADMRQNNPRDWRECELKAVLPGFTSQVVDLGGRMSGFGNMNIGNIVVRRIWPVNGLTVSAKAAPDRAMKDYEKGLEEKKKGKLDAAQQKFRKAVAEYPQYALAWLELGRVQTSQNDVAGARQSFHHSIAADPKLLGPYQELAQLAARDKQWQEVADTTDQLLKLDPLNAPEFWFYNCVAKYQLANLDAAENSALQGIKIDTEHRIPKIEYVLGVILVQKHDNSRAAEHLRKYLSLAPNGPDAADAQKQLEEVEKASTDARSPQP